MRIFYMDESEKEPYRYYVKVDNIIVSDEYKSIKLFEAYNTKELISKICEYYGFKSNNKITIQLWSAQMGAVLRERLDILEVIPGSYEFIWVRGVLNSE